MSDSNGFEIVKDFVPNRGAHGVTAPVEAILDGETIFLPNRSQKGLHGQFVSVRSRGYKLHTQKGERHGVPGVYVWAEKVVPA